MKPVKTAAKAASGAPRGVDRSGVAPVPKAPRARTEEVAARVRPEEWRGSKRNAAIQDAIVAKFKVLNARGKTLTQIADRLGISIGRAKNISAEIRLGKK